MDRRQEIFRKIASDVSEVGLANKHSVLCPTLEGVDKRYKIRNTTKTSFDIGIFLRNNSKDLAFHVCASLS